MGGDFEANRIYAPHTVETLTALAFPVTPEAVSSTGKDLVPG
jgi:hypothetical protein